MILHLCHQHQMTYGKAKLPDGKKELQGRKCMHILISKIYNYTTHPSVIIYNLKIYILDEHVDETHTLVSTFYGDFLWQSIVFTLFKLYFQSTYPNTSPHTKLSAVLDLKNSFSIIYKLFSSWRPHKVKNVWYYYLCGDI